MGDTRSAYDRSAAAATEPSLPSSASSSPSRASEGEEAAAAAPRQWKSVDAAKRRTLSKQLSMREVPRNIAWERRRRQFQQQERRKSEENLTDEDLKELKGCIELGFGFNAEEGQRLCTTIPALDLYFAVNRQFLTSPLTSPGSGGSRRPPPPPPPVGNPPTLAPAPVPPKKLTVRSCSFNRSMGESDSFKILSPGTE